MRISNLSITNFRNLAQLKFSPTAGINLILGPNGAGKTSILEALLVLAKGRSFRSGRIADLIGPESQELQLFAKLLDSENRHRKLGLARDSQSWRGRLDGETVKSLSQLSELVPLVLVDPTSHGLVDGSPDKRRRFIDWGVFHVKHGFLPVWRRYQRILKQRNALLKSQTRLDTELLNGLDAQLADTGCQVDDCRKHYVESLSQRLQPLLELLSETLPQVSLRYYAGFSGEGLEQYLARQRQRDIAAGATRGGPHRADLRITTGNELARDRLSRGQQKLTAIALLLAQGELFRQHHHAPVWLLDDLGSELDHAHLQRLLRYLAGLEEQAWITSVDDRIAGYFSESTPVEMFHVKHGALVDP